MGNARLSFIVSNIRSHARCCTLPLSATLLSRIFSFQKLSPRLALLVSYVPASPPPRYANRHGSLPNHADEVLSRIGTFVPLKLHQVIIWKSDAHHIMFSGVSLRRTCPTLYRFPSVHAVSILRPPVSSARYIAYQPHALFSYPGRHFDFHGRRLGLSRLFSRSL